MIVGSYSLELSDDYAAITPLPVPITRAIAIFALIIGVVLVMIWIMWAITRR